MSLLPDPFPLPERFVVNTDFKCVDRTGSALPICFGIGVGNHATLQLLQQSINQFSELKGFTPLTVDGFIGPDTVAAVQAVIPLDPPRSKERIAEEAPGLLQQIDRAANQLEKQGFTLAAIGTPVVPSSASVASTGLSPSVGNDIVAATTAPTTAAGIAAVTPKSKFLPWILGGIAVVAAVGFGGYFYHRHKIRTHEGWGDYDDADEFGADEED